MSKSSPSHVRQTAAWANKYQFLTVMLHPNSKAANSRDYTDPNYKSPPEDAWRGNHNIGLVTGRGLVDVDCDSPEAVSLVPRFMPQTSAIFGRASKRRSHYLYRLNPNSDPFEKLIFLDPVTRSTLLELRGDGGHQTMAPGSVHPSGETVEWDEVAFPEMTSTVLPEVLIEAGKKVAIAALIARYIWQPGFHNEPCMHLSGIFFYSGWSREDAEVMIRAVMDFSGDVDKSRIPTVRTTYRRGEQGKKITGAGALRKVLNNDQVVDKLLEWMGSNTSVILQEYNERFATVMVEGKYRIADFNIRPGEPPTLMLKDDFLNMTLAEVIEVDDKKIPKARIWMKDARRRHYGRVDFMPGVEDDDSDVLNLWTGWTVRPKEGCCDAWLELLREVICGGDAELNRWMLHWFANILREPCEKSFTAPVIIGDQRVGKSLLFSYFGRILGPGYMVATDPEHIYGRFNKHLAITLLLHSEEALYGGDKKHRGIIKSLITDEYRIFEPKGIDAKRVSNYLRLGLTSNEEHAAPVEAGDGRFTVINMRPRRAGPGLVRRLLEERGGGGPAALHHYLATMEYDPAVPRTNLKNEALGSLKAVNRSPLEAWWQDTLMNGKILPEVLAWATRPENDDWPQTLSSEALYTAAQLAVGDRTLTKPRFANELNKWLGRRLTREVQLVFNNPYGFSEADTTPGVPQSVRMLRSGRHYSIENLPPLGECRAALERYCGQKIEWPRPCEEEEEPPSWMKEGRY
jgi:hypothetical protein